MAGMAKLRGMFAYAIWDSRKRQLFMARDRFGKKPLYYAVTREGLAFGSELKCLREAGVPLEIDNEALRLYFCNRLHPGSLERLHRQFEKIAPGIVDDLSRDGRVEHGRLLLEQLPVPSETMLLWESSEDQAAVRVRELFDESVRFAINRRCSAGGIPQRRPGFQLHRGVHGAADKEPVKTFSIGFEEREFNELPYARLVAKKYGDGASRDHRAAGSDRPGDEDRPLSSMSRSRILLRSRRSSFQSSRRNM